MSIIHSIYVIRCVSTSPLRATRRGLLSSSIVDFFEIAIPTPIVNFFGRCRDCCEKQTDTWVKLDNLNDEIVTVLPSWTWSNFGFSRFCLFFSTVFRVSLELLTSGITSNSPLLLRSERITGGKLLKSMWFRSDVRKTRGRGSCYCTVCTSVGTPCCWVAIVKQGLIQKFKW